MTDQNGTHNTGHAAQSGSAPGSGPSPEPGASAPPGVEEPVAVRLAVAGSPRSGVSMIVNAQRHALQQNLHFVDQEYVLRIEDGAHDASVAGMPRLRDYYADAIREETEGDPADMAAAEPGAGVRDALPIDAYSGFFVADVARGATGRGVGQGARGGLPSGLKAGGRVPFELHEVTLSDEPVSDPGGAGREDALSMARRLCYEFDAVQIVVSANWDGLGSDLTGTVSALENMSRVLREHSRLEGDEPPRLRAVTIAVSKIDLAYYGLFDKPFRQMSTDDSFLETWVKARLSKHAEADEAAAAGCASGDEMLVNLLYAARKLDEEIDRAFYGSGGYKSPIVAVSAFGGVDGTDGLNLDFLDVWNLPGASEAATHPEMRPILLTRRPMGGDADSLAEALARSHAPVRAADGFAFLMLTLGGCDVNALYDVAGAHWSTADGLIAHVPTRRRAGKRASEDPAPMKRLKRKLAG